MEVHGIERDQLDAMREWVADCEWPDVDDVAELTDAEIVRGVERHYCGGLSQFMRDAA